MPHATIVGVLLPLGAGLAAYLVVVGSLRRRPSSVWRDALRPARTPDAPRHALIHGRTLLRRLRAPRALLDAAARLLDRAGAGERLTPHGIVVLSAGGALAAALGWLALAARGGGLSPRDVTLAVLAGAVALAAPWVVLHGRATRRRETVERALPDLLDLLTVSIEAGLALEGALARVCQRGDGPLVVELRRVLSEIGLGRRRREALVALAERTGAPPLRSLVTTLNQADRSGMQLGPVLRAQAEQLRQTRRQRAEEAAMKAPLKMLFPLVMFVFPSVFLVIIGPAVIGAMQTLGGR